MKASQATRSLAAGNAAAGGVYLREDGGDAAARTWPRSHCQHTIRIAISTLFSL
jgi:hypothetical protein